MAKLSDESNVSSGLPESIYGNLDEVKPTSNSKVDSSVSRIDREVVLSLEKKNADVTLARLEPDASSNPSDEDRIRGRAYDLYVQSGYADGHADEHWFIARREIEQLSAGTLRSGMLSSDKRSGAKSPTVEEPTFPSQEKTQPRLDKKVA